jgi:polyphenol oxidase
MPLKKHGLKPARMPQLDLARGSLPVEWAAPAGVGAFMSTRTGGASAGPFAHLNLGTQVGDAEAQVAENRRLFTQALGVEPCWLRQVHGVGVVDAAAHVGRGVVEADASWTSRPGVACVVQVADCLPVLLAARNGRAVGAAHAGWRGLAGGVVEAALGAVVQAAQCDAGEVVAWLGPCIGPRQFEVGADVLAAFGAADAQRFVPRPASQQSADGRPRWLADLPGLARARLQRAGVSAISGGEWCTVEDRSRFFSFRRDGVTGRMAGAVWLRGD